MSDETDKPHRIQIGCFSICKGESDDTTWIEKPDGEGSEFDNYLFEEIISEFYDEHF